MGIVFLLTACVTEPKPPAGTLSKQQMVAILAEIHVAEATAQQVSFRGADSTQLFYKHLERQILRRFNTDSTQYHDSYRWYVQHVREMNEIYTAVVDTLSARQAEARAKGSSAPPVSNPPAPAKTDSLRLKFGRKSPHPASTKGEGGKPGNRVTEFGN